MTIKEWKKQVEALHKAMKEDLGAETLEISIEEETLNNYPCLSPISRTNIQIWAK